MISFFKRLWRILTGELHNLADKFEEPIKMTKQGIRELQAQLDESLKSYAEVRAIAIRSKNEVEKAEQEANDYKKKAMALLQKAQKGEDAANSERLAAEAMAQREQKLKLYQISLENQQKYDKMSASIDSKLKRLKSEIAKWQNELKSLEARQKAAAAGIKINQVMAGVDSSKTLEMLNKLKERVENEEALSDAYGEMVDTTKSLDEEINAAVAGHEGNDALLKLKEEMGLVKKQVIDIKPESEIISIEVEKNDNSTTL